MVQALLLYHASMKDQNTSMNPVVHLKIERRSNHPWIFQKMVEKPEPRPKPGSVVDIIDRDGHPAVGARVVVTAGGVRHTAMVTSGGSYLAASQPRVWVGIGSATAVERAEIDWPWGATEPALGR